MANFARLVSSTFARLKPRVDDAPGAHPHALDEFPPEVALTPSRKGALAFDKGRSGRRNPLEEFPPETALVAAEKTPQQPRASRRYRRVAVIAAAVLGAVGTGLVAWQPSLLTGGSATGLLRVESNPPAATILVDGQPQGSTPATLRMGVGRHDVTIRHAAAVKSLAVDIVANATIVHHVELPPVPAAPVTGSLQVNTVGPAAVVVDGAARGTAPLTIDDLAPGEHRVVVTIAGTSYTRAVQIDPGQTVSLVIGGELAAAAPGWLTARTPLPFTIAEDGQVVGTTESPRILLTPGQHRFEFRNDELGYRTTLAVRIDPGRVTTVQVPLPRAPLQINALPWAEVWIDGERIGETPLANVMQTIGPHEVVFRHPQLGEKRVTTLVTLGAPARATVDMRTR